jgi:hypothetical protein
MIDPPSINLDSLSALYDFLPPMPRLPMAILMPLQKRFNDQINMQIEAIQGAIPVYYSEYLPVIQPAKYLTLRRAQYKTRAGFKKARNYWRWFHREVGRKERNTCFVFYEHMERKMNDMTFPGMWPK